MCVCGQFSRSYCTREWVPVFDGAVPTHMVWTWVERVESYEPKDCPVHQPLLDRVR